MSNTFLNDGCQNFLCVLSVLLDGTISRENVPIGKQVQILVLCGRIAASWTHYGSSHLW
jgi:hypothetical protein